MDAILGGFAFAAFIVGQFAAVIVVRGRPESRETTIAPPRTDYRASMIWEGGS